MFCNNLLKMCVNIIVIILEIHLAKPHMRLRYIYMQISNTIPTSLNRSVCGCGTKPIENTIHTCFVWGLCSRIASAHQVKRYIYAIHCVGGADVAPTEIYKGAQHQVQVSDIGRLTRCASYILYRDLRFAYD